MEPEKTLSSVSIRILLVDDFEHWRQSLRSMLRADERLDIVGEAVDGLDASLFSPFIPGKWMLISLESLS